MPSETWNTLCGCNYCNEFITLIILPFIYFYFILNGFLIKCLIWHLDMSLKLSFSSVHHADVHLHVGLAGCDSIHIFTCLHVFQHLDHLPKHDRSGGSKFMSWPAPVWYVLQSVGFSPRCLGVVNCAKKDVLLMICVAVILFFLTGSYPQCWEGYFGNVIGYSLQVTLFKM